jgi:hypothetical protein
VSSQDSILLHDVFTTRLVGILTRQRELHATCKKQCVVE